MNTPFPVVPDDILDESTVYSRIRPGVINIPAEQIHGHLHKRCGADIQLWLPCGSTTIVNASGHYILLI